MNAAMQNWQSIEFPETLEKTKVGRENQILSSEIMSLGLFPVIDQSQAFIAGYSDDSERVISEDLPLVIFGDHTRCVKYVDFPFILGADGTKVLKPKKDLFDPKFFYYALLSLDIPNRGYNRHFTLLKEKKVPCPKKDEQQKIAAVLGVVQRAIEQQGRLLQLTAELKKALLHQLFTQGLRGELQKQTEIGPVPESWEVVGLSEGVSIKNGQVDPKVLPFREMTHVGPENIEPNTGRLLNLLSNGELRISSGNYHFTNEDILYSKIRPYLKKAALPDFEGTCSADMYPLRPKNDQFVRTFLFQLLLSDVFSQQAVSHQDRTGIPKINRVQLGSVLLPKPSLDEQIEIAEALSIIDQRIDWAHRKCVALSNLFRALLHQLLTAQIRLKNVHFPTISGGL